MGKIRTRTLGLEEIEQKQKTEQKKKALEKNEKKEQEEKKEVPGELKEVKKEESKKKKEEKKSTEVQKKVRGKKYLHARKQIEKGKKLKLAEAIEILKKIKYASFDESVDLHINVDQTGLRGEIELPHSTGKKVRVAIVDDAVIESLTQGKIEFDILITHPSFMPKLARFAKVLGPKGLMPNPKAGTISPKPEEVAKKFEKGMLRWKTEPKFPLIHQMIGKLSYDSKKIVENATSFLGVVGKSHIQKVCVTSSMGPSIEIELEMED